MSEPTVETGIGNETVEPKIEAPDSPKPRTEQPSTAPEAVSLTEVSSIRRALDQEEKAAILPVSVITSEQTPDKAQHRQESKGFKEKTKDLVGKLAWNTRLASTVALQFGGLHPWRSDGKWVWILEPWARWSDDARQRFFDSGSDKYFKSFMEHKGRLLNLEAQGYENPSVTLDGVGGIQLLDHRRIHEAQNAKKAIVVNVDNFHGAPKTFN